MFWDIKIFLCTSMFSFFCLFFKQTNKPNRTKDLDSLTPVSEMYVLITTHRYSYLGVHEISFAACVGGSSGFIPLVLLLGSKTSSFALETGPEREASPRPCGNEAKDFQGSYQYSGWAKRNHMGCCKFPNWSYLFCDCHAFIITDANSVLSLIQPKLGSWCGGGNGE